MCADACSLCVAAQGTRIPIQDPTLWCMHFRQFVSVHVSQDLSTRETRDPWQTDPGKKIIFLEWLDILHFLRSDCNDFGSYGKVLVRTFQNIKKIKKRLRHGWEIFDWVQDFVSKPISKDLLMDLYSNMPAAGGNFLDILDAFLYQKHVPGCILDAFFTQKRLWNPQKFSVCGGLL